MLPPLRDALSHASVSIIGICKNAGKTTVLNRLLRCLDDDPRVPAVTSIGRDGEAVDVVTGTEKPGIWLRRGTLAATAEGLLRYSDITREILQTTGVTTPLGEVVVFRALSDGAVQLAGPSIAEQLAQLAGDLNAHGADIVLIDGALSRKSLAAPAVADAVILCAGASFSQDMTQVVEHTAYVCRLLTLPLAEGENPCRHAVEGALTDAMIPRLGAKPGDEITVLDGSRVLLTQAAFGRLLARGVRLTVRRRSHLCCVCVNPYSTAGPGFDKDQFLEAMAHAVPVPVINAKEAE